MENFLTFVDTHGAWIWLGFGILLLAGEMVIPGVYLLWIGLAAGSVGAFVFAFPETGFALQGIIFTALTALLIILANRFLYGEMGRPEENGLNDRGAGYVGKTFVVVKAIENGRGQIKVGDSLWLASGADAPKGARVRVVSADGAVLVTTPENSEVPTE